MSDTKERKPTIKAQRLLDTHEASVIKELGPAAFELLTPAQTARELSVEPSRISDLVRQGWLAGAPGKDVGMAHQYYRWRVEFVKRYKASRKKESKIS